MSANTNLDSFFDEIILDNNNKSVSDINSGLRKLFEPIVDNPLTTKQYYLVSDFEEGYPELVAHNSLLSDTSYWWWLLALNGLVDPLNEVKTNWVYSISSTGQIDNLMKKSDEINSVSENNRIGTVVELN